MLAKGRQAFHFGESLPMAMLNSLKDLAMRENWEFLSGDRRFLVPVNFFCVVSLDVIA
jgi:hypothetical protein